MPYEVIAKSDRRRGGIRVHRATGLTRRRHPAPASASPSPAPPARCSTCTPRLKTDKALRRARQRRPTHQAPPPLGPRRAARAAPARHPATRRLLARSSTSHRGPHEVRARGQVRAPSARRYGLPEPTFNTRMGRTEPDFLFPEERVIVEIDGWRFHSDRGAFESDRDRDAERLAAGIETVRITEGAAHGTSAAGHERLHAILRARRRAA